jgi:hypothetical protein
MWFPPEGKEPHLVRRIPLAQSGQPHTGLRSARQTMI